MRTVSFIGTEGDGTGTGPTGAVNGRTAAAGFSGGKKFVEEISPGADFGGEGADGMPVSRTGNWIRTVSCGFTPDPEGFVTGGCGNWMRTVSFFGWSGWAIWSGENCVGKIDLKSPT